MEKSSLFHADGADIFQIIENAILVAAFDHPDELKRQQDTIAELCSKAILQPFPQGAKADEIIKKDTKEIIKKEKEEEEDRSIDVVEEVTRIKGILSGHHHQADDVLFDLLRVLQQLKITYDILEATHIGFAVKVLHKHTSKNIRHLARTVTLGWRKVVDEWIEATDAITENGLDDSGIPLALAKVQEERSVEEKVEMTRQETRQLPVCTQELHHVLGGVGAIPVNAPREELIKPRGVAEPEPGRLPKLASRRQLPPQRKPPSIPQRDEQSKLQDQEASVQAKLEVAKRKLQEGYQRIDNAKKQRTIKVVEQRNMPKKGRRTLRPMQKLKNEIKEWARSHSVKPSQKQ
ncbi:probable mediator of RNA polymerase II transcription subunit 26b [Zingiber officinale]|uniref:probable mediator of RNA polymerase II transcription subunit 26b n=1 Tax=Zingiber officinale TaxID=94328 RepID=UPI001C4B4B87|nr:probable mediator of RNA polymerase II transcription subunit 26b [Zingiber officinale]